MSEIKLVKGREVLDSRGNPTVEAEVATKDGVFRAIAPSGASTGAHEALELRDGGKRFMGKGVLKAVENINKIINPKLSGMDASGQREIDDTLLDLDETENKERLGANSMVSVSMAVCRAGAASEKTPLYKHIAKIAGTKVSMPVPQFNVINGGKHAGFEHDIQEYLLLPVGAENFAQALQMGEEVFQDLKSLVKSKFGALAIQLGDEGGFVPPINNPEERLELMKNAISKAGYGDEIMLGIDAASSEFYKKYDGSYQIGEIEYHSRDLVKYYEKLVDEFNIISIEDGMAEDDWNGWIELTEKVGGRIQVTGDDLLVTNVKRIQKAIELSECNSLLLKVNQIGTVSESIDAANMSTDAGWRVTVSHRSGETEDTFIADLAVGLGASQIKTGAPARGERTAKYNQLLRIEEELANVEYQGKNF